MSKSLKIIQIIMKILKVLCVIGFVFSIIGMIGSLMGIISLPKIDFSIEIAEGMTINDLFEEVGLGYEALILELSLSFVLCAGTTVSLFFMKNYFKNEVKEGTPFSFDTARQLRKNGLINLVIWLAVIIVTEIIVVSLTKSYAELEGYASTINADSFLGTTIECFAFSVIFNYGAEEKNGVANVR